MFHLLPCLTTFNIVVYLNESELNNSMWCFINMQLVAYWAPLNLYYCLLHFAMPYLIKLDMHHTWLCIMPCLCVVCLPCCLLLSSLLLLASVSFWSCEDSFDYIHLSSSWTHSSSLRDLRQDDHYPRYHFYHCLLVDRSISMSRYLPLVYQGSHIAMIASKLFHHPSKLLFGYVTGLLNPLL